jgi:hypothetical protein
MENSKQSVGVYIKLVTLTGCFGLIWFKNFDLTFLDGLDNELKFTGITSGLLLLLDFVIFFIDNRKRFITIVVSYLLHKRRQKLRLSFSYLLKIHDENYLLIYNSLRNQYQPVGGVFKYDQQKMSDRFATWSIERDTNTKVENGLYDLRLFIYDRFKLRKFLSWFDMDEDRESDPWREFHEELVSSGILDGNQFYYIDYSKKWICNTGIYKDQYRDGQESLKVFHVYEMNWSNKIHLEAIQILKTTNDERIIWVSADEIKQGFALRNDKKTVISKTSKLLLNKNEDPRDV